jgi:hypothetical protein
MPVILEVFGGLSLGQVVEAGRSPGCLLEILV